MSYVLLAALIATIAAPFILFSLAYLSQLPSQGSVSGWWMLITAMLGVSIIIVLIVTFPVSLLLGFIGWKRGWRSSWGHIFCGGALAAIFHLALNQLGAPREASGDEVLPYIMTGAICGWIYWGIAVGSRSSRHRRPLAPVDPTLSG